MASGDEFGPSLGPWTVERAVLDTLQNPPADNATASRFIYYLADQERVMGLAAQTLPVPPGPSSYRGGVDSQTFEAEWFPILHVNVRAIGQPDRPDMVTYGQKWQVTVTSTTGDDDEDTARMVVMAYGAAVTQLIVQNGALGIGATNTVITQFPVPELLNPATARQVCRTVVIFETYTAIAAVQGGPITWPNSPYTPPGDWADISTVDVTVTAVAPS